MRPTTSVEGRAFQYRDNEPGGRESAVRVLFIASADLIAAWSSRVAATRDVLTFPDTDWQNALEAIARRRPQLVVIEQVFATTSRGMTFINGIQANPNSSGVEIRMLPPERTAALISSQLTVVRAAASLAALAQPFWSRPTRRAARIRTPENLEARVDGSPVSVVDVSVCGAQVLSVTVLRPNQRVRVLLPDEWGRIGLNGVVAWAAFEIAGARAIPRYRAGIEFSDAAPRMLEALCSRLCREAPPRAKQPGLEPATSCRSLSSSCSTP